MWIYGGEIYAKQGFFNDKLTFGLAWSYVQKKTKTHAAPGLRQYTEFTIHPRNATASITITPREEFNLALNGTYQSSRYVLVNNIREVRDLGTESITRSWYAQTKPILYFDFVANYWQTKKV